MAISTTTSGGTTTSFSNTPQAMGDLLTTTSTGILLTEESGIVLLDVMANDLGGAAKSLWSLDNNDSLMTNTKVLAPADLLAQDTGRTELLSTDLSKLGAVIWITSDGKVGYNTAKIQSQLQALAVGETLTDSFTYAIRLGNGTLSWATATVKFAGANDGVTITTATTTASGVVVEDGTQTSTGTISFTDADLSDTHTATSAALPTNTTNLGTFLLAPVSEAANPANGSVAWSYTINNAAAQYLAAGQSVTEVYAVTVKDGQGSTTIQNITITITGTNDIPVISGETTGDRAVKEESDLTASGTLTIVDTDTGESFFTPATAVNTLYGSYTLGANGVWSYSLNNANPAVQALGEGVTMTDSFTAVSQDSTASKLVTITITGTNDIPTAVADVNLGAAVTEAGVNPSNTVFTGNSSANGNLLTNDTDPDTGDSKTVTTTGTFIGIYGSVTILANGGWTYSLNNADPDTNGLKQDQAVSDTFNYTMKDGSGATSSSTLTVNITGTNDTPTTTAVTLASIAEDSGARLITQLQLLSNASDPDGNPLTATNLLISSGSGSLVNNNNGTWSYTPALNDDTSVSFSYTVTDGSATAAGSATLDITPMNDAPVAVADTLSATEDTAAIYTAAQLLGNDTDVDNLNSALSIASVTSGTGGTAVLNSNGTVTFTPTLNFNGTATFSYTVSDGSATSVLATVTVNVSGVNDAPVNTVPNTAVTPLSATEDTAFAFTSGNKISVTDVDGNLAKTQLTVLHGTLSVSLGGGASISAGANGSATLTLSGTETQINAALTSLSYQGVLNYNGNETLTVVSTDSAGTPLSDNDVVAITVGAVNDAPIANNDILYVSNSTIVTLPLSILLDNDTDVDGLALNITAISVVTGTLASAVTVNSNGTFSFTTGATGGTVTSPTIVTLNYTLSDGDSSRTATGLITLNVLETTSSANPVNLTGINNYQGSFIDGKDGKDILSDGAFQSVLLGSSGADTLNGNAGSDLLVGGDDADNLNGGEGNDVLRGGLGNNDVMDGGAGTEDLLDFSDGTVGLTGATALTLVQNSISTTLANGTAGLGNNDSYQNIEGVIGTNLADTITGSASDDIIRGGGGDDTLNGAGNTAGGFDLIDFSDATLGINFTLNQSISFTASGLGNDTYSNFEGVIGTVFADTLTGSALADQLRGGAGNDTLSGLAGNDILVGGAGADAMSGGLGSDTFRFFNADASAVDTITDFTVGTIGAGGDVLDISNLLAGAVVNAGNLATFVTLRESGGNTIISVDQDAGGLIPAQDIVTLTGVANLTLAQLQLNGEIVF